MCLPNRRGRSFPKSVLTTGGSSHGVSYFKPNIQVRELVGGVAVPLDPRLGATGLDG